MEEIASALQQQQPSKSYAQPGADHVSLGRPLRFILFLIPTGIFAAVILGRTNEAAPQSVGAVAAFAILMLIAVRAVRVAAEWERGVVLRFGRFHDVRGPGIFLAIPAVDYIRFVDKRILALNIPRQRVITKDNVPAMVDGVLFFQVEDPRKAVTEIQNYRFAISQYAQASLRDVVGGMTLDELLTERERVQTRVGEIVEVRIRDWGVHVDSIRLLDIEMPEDLKKMMSRQASAEREKRATITKAEGDKMAALSLAQAAEIMAKNPGAMQLRTLQSIDGLGSSPSNTIVLFPVELADALQSVGAKVIRAEQIKPGDE
ncbi:MAG TPA: SPFH domain-containing protein [Candidatus Brocadiia bacterium]|nr:SPFH domain-containing protein [Candidatus Brocadiia bacterium]